MGEILTGGMDVVDKSGWLDTAGPSTNGAQGTNMDPPAPPQTPRRQFCASAASDHTPDSLADPTAPHTPRSGIPWNFCGRSASASSNSLKCRHSALKDLPPDSSMPSEKRACTTVDGAGLQWIREEFGEFNCIMHGKLMSPSKSQEHTSSPTGECHGKEAPSVHITKAKHTRIAIDLAQTHTRYLQPESMVALCDLFTEDPQAATTYTAFRVDEYRRTWVTKHLGNMGYSTEPMDREVGM
ncbi:hypothetical protein K439DRAFT_1620930 [Ramaria rubella]|nr:hypothetical protein K439DRAFT_1620930 [Ramaria rubella]